MNKVITIESTAKASLLLALASMGITPSKTEDKNGSTEITVDLTDDQVKTLEQAFNNGNATVGMMVRDGIDKVTDVVGDIAHCAVVDIAVPVGITTVKLASKAGAIALEGAATGFFSVVNNLVKEGANAVTGIQQNDEYQKLGQSWQTVKNGCTNLFGKKAKISIK